MSQPPEEQVKNAQIKLLYDQLIVAISGEFFVVCLLAVAFWNVASFPILISWLFFTIIFSDLAKIPFIYLFKKKNHLFSNDTWLKLFLVGVVISGVAWGIASSIIIPEKSLLHQTFIIFIITGVTAAANLLYSPVRLAYLLFLFTSYSPFIVWLFIQGNIYLLLGVCGLAYIGVMVVTSYYANKLLVSSLMLRFKLTNLKSVQESLENEVASRTMELEKALALTQSTLESTTDGILVVNLAGNIDYYNQKFLKMWNLTSEFIETHNDNKVLNHVLGHLKNPEKFLGKVKELYENIQQESFDELNFIDGKVFERYSKPHWLDKKVIGRVWSFRDVTLRTHLHYQANHDYLTGLPNRTSLCERINQSTNYAIRNNNFVALLFLDIDNFKLINDNLGHDAGDKLLKITALRLVKSVRESDIIVRFGGDEFVLIFIINQFEEAIRLAQKILKKITEPIKIENKELIVTTSIGISLHPKDGTSAEILLKNADLAMYAAKKEGRNNFQFYNHKLNQDSLKCLELQTQIYNAINNKEFYLLYQPIYNLATGMLVSVEALIRWQHPVLGIIAPNEFIPIAEKNGAINQIGEWVFKEACRQNTTWKNLVGHHICIAVNVSWQQFRKDNFLQRIKHVLIQTKLDPRYMELELTESSMMENSSQLSKTLLDITNLGMRISIDDFGAGYSNLGYLKTLPVNKLKIDKSFINDCITDVNDASIVEAIIALAHGLKLKVVAEGVDTNEKALFLKKLGCDEAQGFLYSPPISANKIPGLLQKKI